MAPTDDEVKACFPFLLKQIELVNPKIIIPLRAAALKRLMNDQTL